MNFISSCLGRFKNDKFSSSTATWFHKVPLPYMLVEQLC